MKGMDNSPGNVTNIASDICFHGNIKASNPVCVYGQVNGKIQSSNTVEIASMAEVIASLEVKSLNVFGKLQANVVEAEYVHLQSTSIFRGDIICKQLDVDQGSKIIGSITVN